MTPTTVITGFLGTGKTTAIRSLLAHAPPGERWAVLVNELGEIGIDAATLDAPGLFVQEVAGGCICCSVSVPFRVAVTRVLAEVKPDRLLVEPSGLADPTSLIDLLRGPYLRDVVDLRATIGLVHPHRCFDPRVREHPVHRAQLACADVLVAGFADTSSEESLQAFRDMAESLDPPKVAVRTIANGQLDPTWLNLDPAPKRWRFNTTNLFQEGHGYERQGWVFPPETQFDAQRLEEVLNHLVRPNEALPDGVQRLKGIFRCNGRWRRVDASPDAIQWQSVLWRRDSRVQFLTVAGALHDWSAVEEALRSACTPVGATSKDER